MSPDVAVRRRDVARGTTGSGRPVLLVTIGAPLSEEAAAVALDAAIDSGHRLILANVTRLEPLGLSVILGYDALEELTPETSASLRGLAERARALGLSVERLRVRSPRPVSALMELVAERQPGLTVFGPDRGRAPRRLYRNVVAALRKDAGCLIWLPA
jgi:nucleotide-binding universal stress UspA family protein